MRQRKVHQQLSPDGAFPIMSSSASRASSARSGRSSSSGYYKQYNVDDVPRPMCGQAALNKILAVGSPLGKTVQPERKSLLGPSSGFKPYEQMPYDVTPMDNIYSQDRTKFSPNFSDPTPSADAMIYIPQFNVNKAKQVQAKQQPASTTSRPRRLPSVTEVSKEDTTENRSQHSSQSTISSASNAAPPPKGSSSAPSTASRKEKHTPSKDRRIEQMIRSMQEIIMKQEDNINTLGSQNEQYRENMTLFQDHVINLRKEQLNQKNEIHKLHFERESYEAETTSLREELKTMRSQLAKAKSERGTAWSPKGTSAKKDEAPWMRKDNDVSDQNINTTPLKEKSPPSSSPKAAPWTTANVSADKEIHGKPQRTSSSQKQNEPGAVAKRQSVSFHDHINEVQYVQERDDAPSDMRWERSKQRSVFTKNGNGATVQPPAAQKPEETREASPKHSVSGKCSDLQELQARANELRDTVAKMKLEDGPSKKSKRHSPSKSPRSPVSYDERKRDAVLRYSRGERATSYWNSHDMYEGERDM